MFRMVEKVQFAVSHSRKFKERCLWIPDCSSAISKRHPDSQHIFDFPGADSIQFLFSDIMVEMHHPIAVTCQDPQPMSPSGVRTRSGEFFGLAGHPIFPLSSYFLVVIISVS